MLSSSSMRHPSRSLPRDAFTLFECLVVLAVLCLLALLFIGPRLIRPGSAKQINCVNNLKNLGLAFRTVAEDDGLPYYRNPKFNRLPEGEGKSAPYLEDPSELWRTFAALSNEVSTPKIVACPSDTRRSLRNTWECVATNDRNGAISYALGLHDKEEQPSSILLSDRNLSLDGLPVGMGVITLRSSSPVGFYTNMHNLSGNVLLGDGSVQQLSSRRLRGLVHDTIRAQTNSAAIRIVVP